MYNTHPTFQAILW